MLNANSYVRAAEPYSGSGHSAALCCSDHVRLLSGLSRSWRSVDPTRHINRLGGLFVLNGIAPGTAGSLLSGEAQRDRIDWERLLVRPIGHDASRSQRALAAVAANIESAARALLSQ